jgi:outer membrane biosynthesis protein TonB
LSWSRSYTPASSTESEPVRSYSSKNEHKPSSSAAAAATAAPAEEEEEEDEEEEDEEEDEEDEEEEDEEEDEEDEEEDEEELELEDEEDEDEEEELGDEDDNPPPPRPPPPAPPAPPLSALSGLSRTHRAVMLRHCESTVSRALSSMTRGWMQRFRRDDRHTASTFRSSAPRSPFRYATRFFSSARHLSISCTVRVQYTSLPTSRCAAW